MRTPARITTEKLLRAFYGPEQAAEIVRRVGAYFDGRADNPATWLRARYGRNAPANVMACYRHGRQ